MTIENFIKIFETFGLPIALIVVLLVVIYLMGKHQNETAEKNMKMMQDTADKNMKAVQDRCKERENVLLDEIKENRKINAKAIDTIAHYSEKLEVIQSDIREIKHDVSLIMISEGNKNG